MINTVRQAWWRRWIPVVGLMLLSPFCAEYLVGYQGVITNPVGMLVAVLMVLPLYGAPAVIIREITRRTRRGWPTMLLLATAAGLIQAGLVDQSLFNHDGFGTGAMSTLIPVIDVDAGQLLTFVVGHIIWSFGAPIAVVESLVPRRAAQPWLGFPGLVVISVSYLAGALFYYNELVVKAGFVAHPMQLIGVAIAVLFAIVAAFRIRGRSVRPGPILDPLLTGVAVAILATGFVLLDDVAGWFGFVARCAILVVLGLGLAEIASRQGWGRAQVLAVAAAVLLVYAGVAFLVNPEGRPASVLYTARGVVAAGMVLLLALAGRRVARADGPDPQAATTLASWQRPTDRSSSER
ncbi:hypothetical protein [Microlunatus soli]|uniref:Uncharacterized protein n=1 Tax=Microlunatus soli TaxID=630515 RepID=A0A1H2A796_9ACTN|nr:hypothetical protein [Microlunatus soli]SDT41838.1 hypothetical protein SAMN04489812_5722 [Microlunatus soli]